MYTYQHMYYIHKSDVKQENYWSITKSLNNMLCGAAAK